MITWEWGLEAETGLGDYLPQRVPPGCCLIALPWVRDSLSGRTFTRAGRGGAHTPRAARAHTRRALQLRASRPAEKPRATPRPGGVCAPRRPRAECWLLSPVTQGQTLPRVPPERQLRVLRVANLLCTRFCL